MIRRVTATLIITFLAALTLTGIAVPAGAAVVKVPPQTVVFVGDSLTYESTAQITAQFPKAAGWHIIVIAVIGSGVCEWLPMLQSALAAHPETRTVVVESVGNSSTCTPGIAQDTPEWVAATGADLAALRAAIPAGTRALFARPPDLFTQFQEKTMLDVVAQATAAGFSVRNYGAALTSPAGYTLTLPCLVTEGPAKGCGVTPVGTTAVVPAGRILVRSPFDLIHFCPGVLSAFTGCPVKYSSGELRWARGMAKVVKTS